MTPAVARNPTDAHPTTAGCRPMHVMLVGTYPPTECGIATHTANLRCALDDAGMRGQVIRLLDPDDPQGVDRRDDLTVTAVRTVQVGRLPG